MNATPAGYKVLDKRWNGDGSVTTSVVILPTREEQLDYLAETYTILADQVERREKAWGEGRLSGQVSLVGWEIAWYPVNTDGLPTFPQCYECGATEDLIIDDDYIGPDQYGDPIMICSHRHPLTDEDYE